MLTNLSGLALTLSDLLGNLLGRRDVATAGMFLGFSLQALLLGSLLVLVAPIESGCLRGALKAQPSGSERLGYLYDCRMVLAFSRDQQGQEDQLGILAGQGLAVDAYGLGSYVANGNIHLGRSPFP